MTDFRLFSGNASGQTNRGGFTDDLGVQFKVTTDGVHDAVLNGFYFWAPTTGDFDHTKYSWRLYSTTNGTSGTLISGSTTNVAVNFTANSWNYQALASPITLTNGTTYVAALHSTSTNASHYTGTNNYWSSGAGASGISSGPITAPGTSTALGGAQNAYNEPSASAAFPTSTLNTNYWLDVSISYDGPVTDSFTSTGTWTCPTGVTSVDVRCWGGGGAGGGGGASGAAGGGGAGGSFAESFTLPVTASTNYTVTVGAGGAHNGGTLSNGATHDGGDSWFNTSSTVIAKGGAGGQDRSSSGNGTGGSGSTTGCIGDQVYAGGNGASGSGSTGGGGGGGAGTTGAGGNASAATAGTGTSLLGGAGSAGHNGSNATAASVYGGGGGGARASSSTVRRGGDGAAGRVEIQWSIVTAVSVDAGVAMTTATGQPPTTTLAAHPTAGVAQATAAGQSPTITDTVGVTAGVAQATAAAATPVVATGAQAGVAAATAAALDPAITDADSVSVDAVEVAADAYSATVEFATETTADVAPAATDAYDADVFVESNISAGVAAATVSALDPSSSNLNVFPETANAVVIANFPTLPGNAYPIPATVRVEVYSPELSARVDEVESTAEAYDAYVQIDVAADAGLVEVQVDASDSDAQSVVEVTVDLVTATVELDLTQIDSTTNPTTEAIGAVATAYDAGLRIGAGLAAVANAVGAAYDATGHTQGGTSDKVRVLVVRLTADRTYTIPHEIRVKDVRPT